MSNWSKIWENRQVDYTKLTYADLLQANGYDGAQSNLNPHNLPLAQNEYARMMGLERGDDIYEIGCGAGGFLHYWWTQGHRIGGCDISENLIAYAAKALPTGTWHHATAQSFTIGNRWDHVVSFGLCMYISPTEVKDMLLRMLAKARRSVSLYDIPDAAKKEDCENLRRQLISNYDEKYQGLHHHYHSKSELIDYLDGLGVRCSIYDQHIPGYENAKWRFNLTIHL